MSEFDVEVVLLPPSLKRKGKGCEKEKVVTFKASRRLIEMLDTVARMKKTSRSEIIRRAIEKYLAEELRKV